MVLRPRVAGAGHGAGAAVQAELEPHAVDAVGHGLDAVGPGRRVGHQVAGSVAGLLRPAVVDVDVRVAQLAKPQRHEGVGRVERRRRRRRIALGHVLKGGWRGGGRVSLGRPQQRSPALSRYCLATYPAVPPQRRRLTKPVVQPPLERPGGVLFAGPGHSRQQQRRCERVGVHFSLSHGRKARVLLAQEEKTDRQTDRHTDTTSTRER